MSRLVSLWEEEFLSVLLKSFYRKDRSGLQNIINFEAFQQAVNLFFIYFKNEDDSNKSNHMYIIERTFANDPITGKNCCAELGISNKTFYRYRQKYLHIFKNFLLQQPDTNGR